MAVKGVITLGIGADSGITPFILTGLDASPVSVVSGGGRRRRPTGRQMLWRPLELAPVIVEAGAVLLTETSLTVRGQVVVMAGCVLAAASRLQATAMVISWGRILVPTMLESFMKASQVWPYEDEDLKLLGLEELDASH